MDNHSHDNNPSEELKKENEWLVQQETVTRLLSIGAENFLSEENIPNIKESFVDKKECVCCMDEGTADMGGETKLAMAGSGILYPSATWEERLDRVADLYIKHGISIITSHDGCGAAGIAWQQAGQESGTGFKTSDDYGKKWVADLQLKVNEKLKEAGLEKSVETKHITGSEMIRPEHFHNARVTWLDATGNFNPHVLEQQVPKGFLIDYKVSADAGEIDYPFAELQVAINIALGDHGFGKKFTVENPFTIIIIANNQEKLETIKNRVESMIGQYEGRVKVDGKVK